MNVMIIPAAGRGTRLSFEGPKLLYPLAGKTLLSYLIARYQPYIDLFIVVINPDAEKAVQKELDILLGESSAEFLIDFQHEATGMLDAITMPMTALQERQDDIGHVWISWCDQASITAATAKKLNGELSFLSKSTKHYMAMPTAKVTEPYIHLQRDEQGRVCKILQRRENDDMPAIGENDCGLFAMSGRTYFHDLKTFANMDQTMGSETQERNFLPFIAWLNQTKEVSTFPVSHPIETLGINTAEDAEKLLAAWQSISDIRQ